MRNNLIFNYHEINIIKEENIKIIEYILNI